MKSRTTTLLLATAIALAAAGSALAQQAPKPENLIKWRQSAFQVVAWNSGRIKSSLDGGYNKDQVLRSANAIAAIANAGLGSLFAPGTETGKTPRSRPRRSATRPGSPSSAASSPRNRTSWRAWPPAAPTRRP